MLPAGSRMRRREEFAAVVRRGRRAGRPSVVVHLLAGPDSEPVGVAIPDANPDANPTSRSEPGREVVGVQDPTAAPLVGFVVGRAVGNSVTRHRVQRRLRHVLADRLPVLPAGARVVVRALPAAADRTSAELAADVDRALERLGLRTQIPGVVR